MSSCSFAATVGSGGSAYGALFQPIQTQISSYIGIVICILAFCGVYARNVWNAQNFPFLSQLLFYEVRVPVIARLTAKCADGNQNGTEYNQTLILNDDYSLNEEKLAVQGLPWFAATQTVSKIGAALSFGATSMILHSETHYTY